MLIELGEHKMREDAKLQLRLPEDVKRWLKEDALRSDRTMNGQVVAVLRERMKQQSDLKNPTERATPSEF
jgi:predicted HicB family RNase H-like nuclease